jgi:photosystem II stability/assembly factor-like uncharacterized protein
MWEERSFPTDPFANAEIAFANDRDGLLLVAGSAATQCQVQSAAVWHTGDGAGSWQKLSPSGIADAQCKRGLGSADATHAFFAACDPNSAPVIYRTADGGEIWTASRPLPDPPGFTTRGAGVVLLPGRVRAFGSVLLVDAEGGGQQMRYVLRSTDGGATWAYASTTPSYQGALGFVSASRWIQISLPDQSKETTDGGASWHDYVTDYSQAAPVAPVIVFGDASVGYATVRGTIQRTTGGGAHWTTIKTPGRG